MSSVKWLSGFLLWFLGCWILHPCYLGGSPWFPKASRRESPHLSDPSGLVSPCFSFPPLSPASWLSASHSPCPPTFQAFVFAGYCVWRTPSFLPHLVNSFSSLGAQGKALPLRSHAAHPFPTRPGWVGPLHLLSACYSSGDSWSYSSLLGCFPPRQCP